MNKFKRKDSIIRKFENKIQTNQKSVQKSIKCSLLLQILPLNNTCLPALIFPAALKPNYSQTRQNNAIQYSSRNKLVENFFAKKRAFFLDSTIENIIYKNFYRVIFKSFTNLKLSETVYYFLISILKIDKRFR